MDARKVAAQFAAYACYEESWAGSKSREEAVRFAREHWASFQSAAQEGWGNSSFVSLRKGRSSYAGASGGSRHPP
jgi:hypothetical protein